MDMWPRQCLYPPTSDQRRCTTGEGSGSPQSSPATRVVLFKRPLDIIESDPYAVDLNASGQYSAHFMPVLTERFRTDELRGIVARGGAEWDGVVIMSKRGAEAWIKACAETEAENDLAASSAGPSSSRPDWSHTPLFTVGSTARQAIADSPLPPHLRPYTSDPRPAPRNAAQLVPLLLNHPASLRRPYLVLRGDKSLDEIPTKLRSAGRDVREVLVYETSEDPGLAPRLNDAVKYLASAGAGCQVWLAFFAPSAAAMVLPYLAPLQLPRREPQQPPLQQTSGPLLCTEWVHTQPRTETPTQTQSSPSPAFLTEDHGDEASLMSRKDGKLEGTPVPGQAGSGNQVRIKVFAIGETTRAWCEQQGIAVSAVAKEPNAECMLRALRDADASDLPHSAV